MRQPRPGIHLVRVRVTPLSPVRYHLLDWDSRWHWIPEAPSLLSPWVHRVRFLSLVRSFNLCFFGRSKCRHSRADIRLAFDRLVPDPRRFFDVVIRRVLRIFPCTGEKSAKTCRVNRASRPNPPYGRSCHPPQCHRFLLDSPIVLMEANSADETYFGETSILYPPRFKRESTFLRKRATGVAI